jgi:hypothetical protein
MIACWGNLKLTRRIGRSLNSQTHNYLPIKKGSVPHYH